MMANHKENYVLVDGLASPVKVLPGQFITGRFSIYKVMYPRKRKNNPEPITVWRWLQCLETLGNLNIKSNNKYSVISIANWGSYQCENKQNDQQNDQHVISTCTADDQHMITNKNEKNEKNTDIGGNQPCPHREIIEAYNSILSEKMPAVKESLWNGTRKKNLIARWREDSDRQSVEWWKDYFQSVRDTPFLVGENDRKWVADMGWLIVQGNMVKVIEGKYPRKQKSDWI
jgi:hypothetical protein